MLLKYPLPEELYPQLDLKKEETIHYSAPYDLDNHFQYISDGWIVVTNKRLLVLAGNTILENIHLKDCEKIHCEPFINNGVLIAIINKEEHLLARFSMKHITRFSYIARGAWNLSTGDKTEVISKEKEIYCQTCNRATGGTGVCPKCNGRFPSFKKFLDLCRPYTIRLLVISLFMIVSSALNLSLPIIQKNFIDNVLRKNTGNYTGIARFILTVLAITTLIIIINIIKHWWCVTLGSKISMDLRSKLYHKVQILSLSFLNSRKPGEIMNRVVGDTNQIRRFMEDSFSNMLSVVVTMIGALGLMIYMSPMLTFLSTMFMGIVIAFSIFFRKHMRRTWNYQWRKNDIVQSSLQDVISGMRVVKSFGKEEMESERFYNLSTDFAKAQKNMELFWAIFSPFMTFLMGIGAYFATYFGGLKVLGGTMTQGELIQFISYTGILYGPLGWVTFLPRQIVQLVTALDRINDILDETPDIIDSAHSTHHNIYGDISFNHVYFGYKSYDPVLEDISFQVKKGEMIGLVGLSGTGKSTLINLIMRLYDVNRGELLIDGININNIKTTSLHSQIGVVLQETFLFSGTILNNICYAKPKATMEEVILAAKAANAHDFITKMPDGYNTYVGEHGANLSGGERQRIAIARAILNDPKILILDEATSALDTESEYLIQQALDRLTKGRTTFAIAHRLSTLRSANRLIVIDNKKVAEIGTHNQLLEQKGIYHTLVTAQLEMQKITPIEESA